MVLTRAQIDELIDNYVKDNMVDADFYIILVRCFMHLLDSDSFDSDDLENPEYIKSIVESKREDVYAKRVVMRKNPEQYISGFFHVITRRLRELEEDEYER